MNANKGSSESELLVVQNEVDRPTDSDADVIVVEEVLREMSIEDYDRIYGLLSNASIELDSSVPIYGITWQHILISRRGRLLELVLFYLGMREIVETRQPNIILCGADVNSGYSSVLQDVGNELDIPVENGAGSHRSIATAKRFLTSTLLLLPFVVDQLFSLVYRRVRRTPAETGTIFVPAQGRLDSMTPILERASFDSRVLVQSHASSWAWLALNSDLEEYDPLPISLFATVTSLVEQFRLYLSVCRSVFFSSRFKEELRSVVESELGITPDRTINFALVKAFRTRLFTSLLFYHLFDDVLEHLDPDQVVLGTGSPAGKAIMLKGIERGVDVFHVPHSIATWKCPNSPPELTQFVAGELDVRYYRGSPQVRNPWNLVVSGRPYLTDLYRNRKALSNRKPEGEGLRILAATQPNDVCQVFVEELARVVNHADPTFELAIKPHPNEDSTRYRRFESDTVEIVDGDLFPSLKEADLTVTISSNVGLESIILGTPSICYNRWEPVTQSPVYARFGEVPIVEDEDGLREFFRSLTREKLASMQRDQERFANENYVLEEDAAQNIVDHLAKDAHPS